MLARFLQARIGIRGLFEALLAAGEPVRVGPETDRSRYADVNCDLFPKEEFLVGAARP